MKRKPFFRFLCTFTLWFYSVAIVQAGQVITGDQRDWAKKALAQEATLGTIESSQSVAVLYFHNKTTQKRLNALQKGLALMLTTDLSKIDNLFVVERIRVQALLDEMDFGASGLVDKATAPKVGRLLKTYYVVNGDISEGSIKELEFGSYLLDVPFKNITSLPPAAGSLEELFRMEKDLLFNIVEQLNIYVSPAQKKELEMPLSMSSVALLALFLGIDYSDKAMFRDAAQMYERAIAEDPGLQLAQDSLQELKDMGLISSEDISRVEPEPEEIVEESGSGLGTVAAVGLGIAVIAGGAVLLTSSSGSDDKSDDNGSVTPPDDIVTDPPDVPIIPPAPDQTTPTASGNKSSVACVSDEVIFSFSEPMNMESGDVAVRPSTIHIDRQGWIDSQRYGVTIENGSADCSNIVPNTVALVMTLNGFVSSSNVDLGGDSNFAFSIN
jgi:TolB-like protein